jgi:hypothetical protein
MKRNLMVAPLALMLWAHAAWAGAAFVRAASGDIPASSNCTRVSRATPTGEPYTAMRCPTAGGSFVLNYNFPSDSTSPNLTPRLKYLNPDSTVSGNYCFTICMGVAINGNNRANLDVSQCAAENGVGGIYSDAANAQDTVVDTGWSGSIGSFASLVPNNTVGVACTSANCSGAEMSVVVTRVVGGPCSGNSAQNVDILGVAWTYN